MIGDRISHYRVEKPLGKGGMGVVYRARDERLDRAVALKFLPPELSCDEELRRRFVNEAKALSALDHPNVCTIHEIDEGDDGQLFLVMTLYEGESLRDRLRRGPVTPIETVEVGAQIASGLEAAHAAGIVHRDVKPANVFVTHEGVAKLLDFGLARARDSTRLTRTGTTVGTLSYMSPEQIRGEPLDERADVWALGAVLYEMVTGRPPFHADNEGAVVYAILDSEPLPPSLSAPDRADFDPLITKALAKRREDRYSSAPELRRALEELRNLLTLADDQPTRISAAPDVSRPDDSHGAAGSSRPSVAVIDFTNLSADPGADWLTSGIAETVAVDLNRIDTVQVVGRQRVVQLLGSRRASEMDVEALAQIGERLAARWLLWGAFQKIGEAIRITAHCLDVPARRTVETVKLDGTMGEIFDLQDRVIAQLAPAMELELSESDLRQIERPETEDLEAYELCARARQLVYRMDRETIDEARRHLERAIELDPDYALAYSSLGHLHCMRYIGTTDSDDLETAIENLERAHELAPDLADSRLWASYAFSRLDRFDDALEAARTAAALEPHDPAAHYFLGTGEWMRGVVGHDTGGYEEAVRHLGRATELAPRFEASYLIRGDLYRSRGQYDEAADAFHRGAEIERSGDFELARFVGGTARLGSVELRRGNLPAAERLLAEGLELLADSDHVYAAAQRSLSHCARAELALERKRFDEALDHLKVARAEIEGSTRSLGLGWMAVRVDLLRSRTLQALGMGREAREALDRAVALLESRDGYDFSCVWEGGEAEARFELALALAATRRVEDALDQLERAVDLGWAEVPRLDGESSLAIVRSDGRFARARDRVAAIPRLP